MPLHGGEGAHAPAGVHLPHQTVPHARHELGASLVLPVLERHGSGDLEAVEKRPTNLHVARLERVQVHVHHPRGESERRPLHEHVLVADLRLEDRDRLRQRVTRAGCRCVGPEQLDEVVARKPPPGVEREADQDGEMLTRAKPHRLPGWGEQEGYAEGAKVQVRRQDDGSQCRGMVLLGALVNVLSTRCLTTCCGRC